MRIAAQSIFRPLPKVVTTVHNGLYGCIRVGGGPKNGGLKVVAHSSIFRSLFPAKVRVLALPWKDFSLSGYPSIASTELLVQLDLHGERMFTGLFRGHLDL